MGRVCVDNVCASEFGPSQPMGLRQSRVSHACFTACLSVATASSADIKELLCSEA